MTLVRMKSYRSRREVPITRFIGNFDATGQVLINSSSFALVDTYLDSEHSYKGDIFFSNSENGESKEERMEPISEDALVKDLKIVGPYEASVSSNGIFHMPSRPSDYDYVVFSPLLPLDIIIKLHNGSTAEITVGNTTEYFKGGGRSEILIHDLRSGDEGFADILMKNPQVQVINGTSKFSSLYSDDPLAQQLGGEEVGFDEGRPDFSGKKTEVIGNLSFKFDHNDHYASPHRNGTTIMYISYLESLKSTKIPWLLNILLHSIYRVTYLY